VSSGFASQLPGHFADDLVYGDQLPFGRGLPVERTDSVDDFRRTIRILIDSGYCRTPMQLQLQRQGRAIQDANHLGMPPQHPDAPVL